MIAMREMCDSKEREAIVKQNLLTMLLTPAGTQTWDEKRRGNSRIVVLLLSTTRYI